MLIVQMLVTLCVRVMDVMFSTFTMQQKRNVLNAATTAMYVLVQQPQSAFDVVSATQMTAFHLLQQQSGRHGTWKVLVPKLSCVAVCHAVHRTTVCSMLLAWLVAHIPVGREFVDIKKSTHKQI